MASEHIFYCRQCAAENGGPVVDLKPSRTTMALKGLCGNCGFVWMDRDGGCCDAECPIHHPKQNTPETGQHRLARQAAPSRNGARPGDEPVAVGPQAAGRFISPVPLPTPHQAEGLTILMEETFEVLTFLGPRASKCIRFGLDEVQPGQDLTNRHRLSVEAGDLAAMFDLLVEAGAIDGKVMNEAIFNKRAKLREFLQFDPD